MHTHMHTHTHVCTNVQAEVFPLNNLLCSVLLILTLLYLHVPCGSAGLSTSHKLLSVAGGLVCGLSMCNQHTSSIYILVCVVAVARGHEMALLTREVRV